MADRDGGANETIAYTERMSGKLEYLIEEEQIQESRYKKQKNGGRNRIQDWKSNCN